MGKYGKIGIFDSGIGGVTVLKEILEILPKEQYIYYSDSRNNPYGDKEKSEIEKICTNIIKYFIQQNCKAIVIACNTASTLSKNLREKYSKIPIVAIEPAYKMVYDNAINSTSLIMATKETIKSEKFNKLIQKYNNNKTYLQPCIGLADAIEKANKEEIEKNLKQNLNKYIGKVDNVVIGCTHYALIEKEIKEILGNVQFFYGARSLANHLKNILKEQNLLNDDNNKIKEKKEFKYENIQFIDTTNNEQKEKRFFEILNTSLYKNLL